MFSSIMGHPIRFLIAAAVLAAILCLFPARVDAPEKSAPIAAAPTPEAGFPVGADLSERTGESCMLHRTIHYAPCGHSVQRREALSARLKGLTRAALEQEIGSVIPGARVTGFSDTEVDVTVSLDIPCPLHWVLRGGEDGMLGVWQNASGEALSLVRSTDIPMKQLSDAQRETLRSGLVFDDVQALEGYLESLGS
ncbi:MAG: hypothetical protein ACI4PG_08155 [Candidatus Ventricola sp.]